MQFRTELNLSKSKWDIDYKSKIISIGSCFSSHMARKLEALSFNIFNNPYGTFYNPISIFRSLHYSATDFNNTLILRDGKWVSFLSHSDISSVNKKTLLELLNNQSETVKESIKTSDYLILTLGSAKIYTNNVSGLLVANCHKVSQNQFESRLLEPNEILNEFDLSIKHVRSINPAIKIILTVSPVRYLSDGFEMNSLSKAILIFACHKILKRHTDIEYFPAYEMIMDDLRDYRFFEDDLLHSNSTAINYVWGGFSETYLNEETIELANKVNKINKSLNHIPFNPNSDDYKKLLDKLGNDITKIKNEVNTNDLLRKLKDLKSI